MSELPNRSRSYSPSNHVHDTNVQTWLLRSESCSSNSAVGAVDHGLMETAGLYHHDHGSVTGSGCGYKLSEIKNISDDEVERTDWSTKRINNEMIQCEDASAMTKSDINTVFGKIIYQHPDQQESWSVPGGTYEEVLQNLLTEMAEANMNFPSLEVADLESFRQKWISEKIMNSTGRLLDVYSNVLVAVSSASSRKDYFEKMRAQIKIEMKSQSQTSPFLSSLSKLALFCSRQGDGVPRQTDDKQSHVLWNKFLCDVLETFCCNIQDCMMGDEECEHSTELSVKGAVEYSLQITRKTVQHQIISTPDSVMHGSIHLRSEPESMWTKTPIFTCAMKTEHDPNDWTQSILPDPAESAVDVKESNHERTENLPTRHFCELLGSLRSCQTKLCQTYDVFGMYAVKSKVHLTHLSILTDQADPAEVQNIIKGVFIYSNNSSDFYQYNEGKHCAIKSKVCFLMNNFRYLNLFNANHFRAFVSLVQYIQFSSIKEGYMSEDVPRYAVVSE